MNKEIIGKWKVIDVKTRLDDLICVPNNYTDYLKPLINTLFEFKESGDFFYTNYGVDVLKLYNSKWYINDDDIIELQSINYEDTFEIRLKKEEETPYFMYFGSFIFTIERVNN